MPKFDTGSGMKILIVRLSSLGDVLHLFPAISDLRRRFPEARIHWLVEPAFAQMAGWHAAVDKVIPVPLRSHKKSWWKVPRMLKGLGRELKAEHYDIVIDAQGLLKSALLARLAGVEVSGFDADSARESVAVRFYKKTAKVESGLHVIDKNRQLMARLFDIDISGAPDFGLDEFCRRERLSQITDVAGGRPSIVLLHGTTWNSKYWPEDSWQELVRLLSDCGFCCLLPWGSEEEYLRALRLQQSGEAVVLPKSSLIDLTRVLLHAKGFVSVETGIGHLATVLNIPGIMLHGPTDPDYSGILGRSCVHLGNTQPCAPCFKRDCPKLTALTLIPPCQQEICTQRVFDKCLALFGNKDDAAC